jgi:hypothetical protein
VSRRLPSPVDACSEKMEAAGIAPAAPIQQFVLDSFPSPMDGGPWLGTRSKPRDRNHGHRRYDLLVTLSVVADRALDTSYYLVPVPTLSRVGSPTNLRSSVRHIEPFWRDAPDSREHLGDGACEMGAAIRCTKACQDHTRQTHTRHTGTRKSLPSMPGMCRVWCKGAV